MNTTRRNVLIVAALLGLLAALLTYRFLQQSQTAQREKMLTVVVSTSEIKARTIIEPGMVIIRRMRASQVPAGPCGSEQEVIDKVSLIDIPANVPISTTYVGDKAASLGLAFVIPPSMRAVTVAVDPVIGVAGFLKPGDHVDVVATFDRGWGEAVAKTVLQDVQLLAMGPKVEQEQLRKNAGRATSYNKETATILVTPNEAERLVLAENKGKLRLVLRAAGDLARVDSKGVTSASVTGEDPASGRTEVRETTPRGRAERASSAPVYNWPPNYAPPPWNRQQPKKETAAKPAEPQVAENRGHVIEVIRGTEVKKVSVNGGSDVE